MMVNGRMEYLMVVVRYMERMVYIMRVVLLREWLHHNREYLYILMDHFIKVNLKIIHFMVRADFIIYLMVLYILVNG